MLPFKVLAELGNPQGMSKYIRQYKSFNEPQAVSGSGHWMSSDPIYSVVIF